MQCAVYIVQCTVYIVQCTVYSVDCTVYSETLVSRIMGCCDPGARPEERRSRLRGAEIGIVFCVICAVYSVQFAVCFGQCPVHVCCESVLRECVVRVFFESVL